MSKVAKLVIIDDQDKYLLMYRSAHPAFGDDPDLPGGTLELGEDPLSTMVREVLEEAGLKIDGAATQLLYEGMGYSAHQTHYYLYGLKLNYRPEIIMSWEHSAYEWLDREVFLEKAKSANDTYMHMVYQELENGIQQEK